MSALPCGLCRMWRGMGKMRHNGALLWGDEGDSLKHTAIHHRVWYHVGNSSLHASPFGNSPTLIEHCTAAICGKFQPEPGVSHSMRRVMCKSGFSVASPV